MCWLGLVGAVVGFWASLTPSLLPRPWLFLGLICGIGAALGYGLGSFASHAIRTVVRREPSPQVKRVAWRTLAVVAPIGWIAAIVVGGQAQNDVRALVGQDPTPGLNVAAIAVLALVTAVALILAARGIRRVTRAIITRLRRVLPRGLATVVGVLLVALLGYWITSGVLVRTFISWADTTYAAQNQGTPPDAAQPTSTLRSGGPESLVAWDTLGYQGRAFTGRGPTAEQITAISGRPATSPIRVYAGLDSAPTAAERADLAVRELERTGAFTRKVLVVAGATGTGWIEPQSVDSLEYLWNGDTAFATIQYSFLPSWISFLVDQDRATEAGRALFEAVYDRWSTLPTATRPKLIVYGLSLGSFAAQAPFSGVQDLAARTDGALFVGTPNFTEPWSTIGRTRDAGSPLWRPVVDGGRTARYSPDSRTLDAAGQPGITQPWGTPRVAFLQHGSDSVVWWSYDLLSRRPDWLAEERAPDVSPATRWYPVLTFLQVTVDQFFGTSVPDGYGHNYGGGMADAWQAVLPAPGWTPEGLNRVRATIGGYALE
jgi:uncharacterized membrane protein